MTLEFRVGDVFERLAEIPDGSIDLVVTSPPFLALRSYLPADHPDKAREIGSEATPADFLETLLALTAEFGRVLAPHGSICVELGDTFSGGGESGWERGQREGRADGAAYRKGGLPKVGKLAAYADDRGNPDGMRDTTFSGGNTRTGGGNGWPLAKSLTGIPTLYPWSLAYGRNLLSGAESPAGQWRIRNVIVWARPNPPVGALGDKFRPATSYITVACRSAKRYFDLDAVRTDYKPQSGAATMVASKLRTDPEYAGRASGVNGTSYMDGAGAPPLDWHADHHPEDGDWLWKLSTAPYRGSHYATFPLDLPRRLIEAMCPQRVCTVCGRPSERITEPTPEYAARANAGVNFMGADHDRSLGMSSRTNLYRPTGDPGRTGASFNTIGWTDCGCAVTPTCHNDRDELGSSCRQGVSSTASDGSTPSSSRWRTGVVLDPFAGSGTTIAAAQLVGRHAIGVDLDERNAELARDRVGMFLETVAPGEQAPPWEQLPMWEATA